MKQRVQKASVATPGEADNALANQATTLDDVVFALKVISLMVVLSIAAQMESTGMVINANVSQ